MTYRLKWKCGGICGRYLTEGVDKMLVFESRNRGNDEGQVYYYCPQCCEADIRSGGLRKAILIGARD